MLGPLPKWLQELEELVRHLSRLERRLVELLEPAPEFELYVRMESQAVSAKQQIEKIIHTLAQVI